MNKLNREAERKARQAIFAHTTQTNADFGTKNKTGTSPSIFIAVRF